jgi:hypothetical protein
MGRKGDYLGREPDRAVDVEETAGWVDERWTFVTSPFLSGKSTQVGKGATSVVPKRDSGKGGFSR